MPIHPLRRRVPWSIALTVLGAAVLAAAIPTIALLTRIDDSPAVTLPPARIAEFEAKRRALLSADALLGEGKYEEAAKAYEAYLARYPYATAAAEGRARALAAIEETKPAAKTSRRRSSRDEDISPRELLNRIRRVFRR